MHKDWINLLFGLVLSVASWSTPQPRYSEGLIVNYGNQNLIEANARWHGYDLGRISGRCGFSAISPAHLGQLAWVSVDGINWVGPCISVDAVGRIDAYQSIYQRHEIAEISRDVAQALGFQYGHHGYVFFSACPPGLYRYPELYQPPLVWDTRGERTPSFYPYPAQEEPIPCHVRQDQ